MFNIVMDNSCDAIDKLYVAGLFEASYYESVGGGVFSLNLETAYGLVDAGTLKILILYKDEEPVGYLIYNMVYRDLFTERCMAQVITTYVMPEYRRTNAFKELLDNYELSAKCYGATEIYMDLPTDSLDLSRHGFELINHVFRKEV